MSSNITVKTGFWQNHSQTGWKASTLTLSVQDGALLISGLATFITLVGGRFWYIVAFAIHQSRASCVPKDGIHHQQQVVYRNSSSAVGSAWTIFLISWSWRSKARLNWLRMTLFALPPLLCFVAFSTASVLSARVAAPKFSASQVLIKENNCGFINIAEIVDGGIDRDGIRQNILRSTGISNSAREYARGCYDNAPGSQQSCNIFPVQSLPYTSKTDAECPFADGRCLLGQNTAFQLSTDWLDSHIHFGINDFPLNRILFRKVVTCSVLSIEDLITSRQEDGQVIYEYNLGSNGAAPGNITNYANNRTAGDSIGYTIADYGAIAHDETAQKFVPISDFNQTDADLSVFFLSGNSIGYYVPNSDPLFSANHLSRTFQVLNTEQNLYTSDDVARALGCIDQYQVQNPATGTSTELKGVIAAYIASDSLELNKAQKAAAERILKLYERSWMLTSVSGAGAGALKTQSSVFGQTSPGVLDNQWQVEVDGWFTTSLAALQSEVLSFVSKNIDGLSLANVTASDELKPMCTQQVVRDVGAYQSFSVLGISLILTIGVLIMLISFFIETIVGAIQRSKFGRPYKAAAWALDSVLQQQRLAFEGRGVGSWERCNDEVPITAKGEKFVSQDICIVEVAGK